MYDHNYCVWLTGRLQWGMSERCLLERHDPVIVEVTNGERLLVRADFNGYVGRKRYTEIEVLGKEMKKEKYLLNNSGVRTATANSWLR